MHKLSKDSDHPLNTYNDVLTSRLQANLLERCKDCPVSGDLHRRLPDIFNENEIAAVTLKQWISKPRTILEPVLDQPVEKFLLVLQGRAETLLKHAFIAKQKRNSIKN